MNVAKQLARAARRVKSVTMEIVGRDAWDREVRETITVVLRRKDDPPIDRSRVTYWGARSQARRFRRANRPRNSR